MSTKTLDSFQGEERIDSRDLIEAANAIRADILGGDEITEDEVALVHAIDALSGDGVSEWTDGAFLIREDTFVEYAQELAEDMGAMPEGNNWPLYCIDWERAARELRVDYTSVSFLGYAYLVRS